MCECLEICGQLINGKKTSSLSCPFQQPILTTTQRSCAKWSQFDFEQFHKMEFGDHCAWSMPLD